MQEVKIFARPATPMANPIGSIVIDLSDELIEEVTSSSKSFVLSTATQGCATGLGKRLLWGSQNGLDWALGFRICDWAALSLGNTPFPAHLKVEVVLLLQLEARPSIQEVEAVHFC